MSKTARLTVAAVVALVLVAVVSTIVWRTQRDDRARVAVGEAVAPPDSSARILGLTTDLQLPFGDYRVTVGEAVDELPPACCLDEPADVRAPEGGSFVGVAVTQVSRFSRALPVAEPGVDLPTPTFTLLVDVSGTIEDEQTEYPVSMIEREWDATTLANRALQTYVAVDGAPEVDDLAVRVDYDGVSQVLHADRDYVETGDAAQLRYSDLVARQAGCGAVRAGSGFVVAPGDAPLCSTARERLAYVGGVGWAEPGRRWLVVTTNVSRYVSLDRVVGGRRYDYLSGSSEGDVTVASTLGGEPPVEAWDDDNLNHVAVFAQPVDPTSLPLVVSATYGELDDRNDPRPVDEVTVTWRSTF